MYILFVTLETEGAELTSDDTLVSNLCEQVYEAFTATDYTSTCM